MNVDLGYQAPKSCLNQNQKFSIARPDNCSDTEFHIKHVTLNVPGTVDHKTKLFEVWTEGQNETEKDLGKNEEIIAQLHFNHPFNKSSLFLSKKLTVRPMLCLYNDTNENVDALSGNILESNQ